MSKNLRVSRLIARHETVQSKLTSLIARHETVQSKLTSLIEEFRRLHESADRLADTLPEGDELMQVVDVRTHAEEFLDANEAEL